MVEYNSSGNDKRSDRSGITWNFIPAQFIAHELIPNAKRHHSETSENDGSPEPNIDWETYKNASDAGICWAVTARNKGVLIGYAVFTIARNLRYMHIIEATSSGWFIEKKYKGIGTEMSKRADEYIQKLGVHQTNYILSGNRVGKLLERAGYKSTFTIWSKELNG